MPEVRDVEVACLLEDDEEDVGTCGVVRRRPAALVVVGLLSGLLVASCAAIASHGAAAARQRGSTLQRKGVVNLDEEEAVFKKCLCVFDIDRTLTGKQGWQEKCPADKHFADVQDQAYATGTFLAADLAQNMGATFCGECYHGIVTAGVASGEGSELRKHLMKLIGGTARTRTDFWQDIHFKPDTKAVSSLIVEASDTLKQKSVLSMIDWWREKQGIDFKNEDVYFFDDIKENVQPFEGTGINAKQVSCASRGPVEMAGQYEGKIGGCGGAAAEIEKFKGVVVCDE